MKALDQRLGILCQILIIIIVEVLCLLWKILKHYLGVQIFLLFKNTDLILQSLNLSTKLILTCGLVQFLHRIYTGRLFAGAAFLWHKHMHEMVSIDSGSDRIAAAVISYGGKNLFLIFFKSSLNKRLLIVTVYMPVDYGHHKSCDDFMEQLGDLDGILSSVNFNSCICIKDFNLDLWKNRSTRFSN